MVAEARLCVRGIVLSVPWEAGCCLHPEVCGGGVSVPRRWKHTAKQAVGQVGQIRMSHLSGQQGLVSLSLSHHDAAASLKGCVSDVLGQRNPN